MGYSRKLGAPIVSATVATVALTSFATVTLLRDSAVAAADLLDSIWPIILTSSVAVILVMSFLYRSLVELVKELEQRELTAQHQALHDPLTGLANRALLEDRLAQAVARRGRNAEGAALLVLDLDRFKQVNDTLGHAAGDLLVHEVALRLQALLRATDTVARIGGDEFAILLFAPKSAANVRTICQSIIDTIAEPFLIEGREARVGVSIGAVMATRGSSAQELLRKADITMYRAKGAGRNCFRIFTDEMDEAVQRRDRIECRLREELKGGSAIAVHFQPQLSSSGRIVAAEALLRWHDPVLGDITPREVLPIAEECGLIDPLGEFVFARACEAALAWPELTVAVNLSPAQFRRGGLPARLEQMARAQSVSPSQLELEVTESLLIDHGDTFETEIEQLRGSGFRIVLDDFGTGYSSLSYLTRFPIDKLKLDRIFLSDAEANHSIAIIRAAVSLGHLMEVEVVAEGVADAAQEQIALEAGCDGLQGHRYAPAMSFEAMSAFLDRHGGRIFEAAA